jgi:hypothetical protein
LERKINENSNVSLFRRSIDLRTEQEIKAQRFINYLVEAILIVNQIENMELKEEKVA